MPRTQKYIARTHPSNSFEYSKEKHLKQVHQCKCHKGNYKVQWKTSKKGTPNQPWGVGRFKKDFIRESPFGLGLEEGVEVGITIRETSLNNEY